MIYFESLPVIIEYLDAVYFSLEIRSLSVRVDLSVANLTSPRLCPKWPMLLLAPLKTDTEFICQVE